MVHIESDLRLRLWQAVEDAAVQVFAGNLRDLLLAAPAGTRLTMGLDPGYRTGVKVAVVTATGQVAATTTILFSRVRAYACTYHLSPGIAYVALTSVMWYAG